MSAFVEGIYRGAAYFPSPNQDERPEGENIRLLVIHNISLPPGVFAGEGVHDLFLNRIDPAAHPFYEGIKDLRVSAHFFIRRSGEIVQFVPILRRAWHAGKSSWRGFERCNDFSIGIELEGSDFEPFEEAQYQALSALARAIMEECPIEDIVGHADIAPGRKTDPGPHFDWKKFFLQINFHRYLPD